MRRRDPPARLPHVVHLIPYNGLGGVEVATDSVAAGAYDGFTFRKAFLVTKPAWPPPDGNLETGYTSENDPRAFLQMLRLLLRERPDLLVVSLWRCCLIGMILKLFRPRLRLVVLLHNSINAHGLDRVVTWLTVRVAHAIWADSESTANKRLGPAYRPRITTLSFLVSRTPAVTSDQPRPAFIYWGRLHPRKRLDTALAFFARVRHVHPDAHFDIVGPDQGELGKLTEIVRDLDLSEAVTFIGALPNAQILETARSCSFFLMTSAAEGMAMSVIEAMQAGLIPITTPVGEIESYVRSGTNGIWFKTEQQALAEVDMLLREGVRFRDMRAAAIATWADQPTYREEFLAACDAILRESGAGCSTAAGT